VGLPDIPLYPLVDPRGLVTPFYDGWSLDFVVISSDGCMLLPSKLEVVEQSLSLDNGLAVHTSADQDSLRVESKVEMVMHQDKPVLTISVSARCGLGGRLAVSLRPYNPEDIKFVEKIKVHEDRAGWKVDHRTHVRFSREPDVIALSNYKRGDVLMLNGNAPDHKITCNTGMATAATIIISSRIAHSNVL
jgi:hypothetical protein